MSNGTVPESEPGYLSADSKRRFTIVAGVLGAVFFLAQFVLPMAIFFVMMPRTIMRDVKSLELDSAALLGDELWAVERTIKLDWKSSGSPSTTFALARMRLADLSDAGPAIPLEGVASDSTPDLIAAGERLWVLGSNSIGYYEKGALRSLTDTKRPTRASRPFLYAGRPAVISLGASGSLTMLQEDGGEAKWVTRELSLGQPAGVGALWSVQAVEASGSLFVLGLLCSDAPADCSLSYRDLEHAEWHPLVEKVSRSASWTALSRASGPAVFLSEDKEGKAQLSVVTTTASGPQRRAIEGVASRPSWHRWRPLSSAGRFLLVSEGMPGALRVAEIEDGRVARTSKRPGFSPFGPNMMVFTMLPQLLPMLLSLILAFVLTIQMRRHRVPDYAVGAERRSFASLWQRALAQLVDLVPFVAGLALPMVWLWRMFSDPESLLEDRSVLPFRMFGFFIGALLWMLLVLLVYSYLEGRYGKTPGKWLMGIRVLGTDLQPCGFGRAFLRNLLTLVDGFFSFMVGALLVALTENWQRLGDMAARTIVVVDQKPA